MYGKLTVVAMAKRRSTDGSLVWVVDCACGKKGLEKIGTKLTKRRIRSCGCLHKEVMLSINPVLTISERLDRMVRENKKGAKARGLEWTLTDQEVLNFSRMNCFYCGRPPSRTIGVGTPSLVNVTGLDRYDNDKGYTTDNVRPCCSRCNWMKGSMSGREFAIAIYEIYHHIASKPLISAAAGPTSAS